VVTPDPLLKRAFIAQNAPFCAIVDADPRRAASSYTFTLDLA